jgi:hypothetical protein
MIEVFTTDIRDQNQANEVLKLLEQNYPELRINFDFGDWKSSALACKDEILRVEGSIINSNAIISTVERAGFRCDVLPDKICK